MHAAGQSLSIVIALIPIEPQISKLVRSIRIWGNGGAIYLNRKTLQGDKFCKSQEVKCTIMDM